MKNQTLVARKKSLLTINRKKFIRSLAVGAMLAGASLAGRTLFAASDNWVGLGANANWSTGLNWFSGTAPGDTASTTNLDVATFNAAIANTWGNSAGNPIVIDSATQNISGLTFDAAAGNYFIGSTAGNSLLLSSGGTTQIVGSLTATNAIETINAPLKIQGTAATYSFINNSANGTGAGAGTLNIGGAISATAGATVLTLDGTNTNANTISGAISNGTATSVAITKNGTGNWLLSGNSTYTGNTAITAGTLQTGSANALGTSRAVITPGASLDLAGSTTNVAFLFNTGVRTAGSIINSSATPAVLKIGVGQGGVGGASGTYQTSGEFSGTIGSNITLMKVAGTNQSASIMASTSVITGSAVQTLSEAGQFTGNVIVKGGDLALLYGQTGSAVSNILGPTSTLTLQGGSFTAAVTGSNNTQTLAGVTINAGASHLAAYRNSSTAMTLTLGAITRNTGGTVDFQSRVNVGGSSNQHIAGADGTDQTTTANANYTSVGGNQSILGGWATVNQGTWAVGGNTGANTTIGSLTPTSGFAAGTNVDATTGASAPAAMTINSLRFNTAGAYTVGATGNLSIASGGIMVTNTVGANAVALNGNFNLTSLNGQDLIVHNFNTNAAGSISIGMNITGAIGLTKSGVGPMTLAPATANTFTGPLTINAGTVTLGNANALASSTNATAPVDVVFGGSSGTQVGNTPYNGASFVYTNGTLNLNGNSVSVASLTSSSESSGTAVVQNANASGATLTINGSSSTQFDGILQDGTGGGALAISKLGTSTQTLTGANTYTGGTTVGGGTITATSNTALGASANALVLNPSSGTAAVNFTSSAPAIGSLASSGAGSSSIVLGNTASPASATTLTVGSNNTSTTYAGTISDLTGSNSAAKGNLVKSGTGTLTLSGNNTLTGSVTINGGTILANNSTGSATGTGAVAVNNTATLGGTGTASGNVTVASGGAIAPGSGGVGTLTVGTLSLGAGSLLNYDLTSTSVLDKTIVTGSNGLTINGGQFTFNSGANTITTNGVYNLIGYTGSIGGTGTSALSLNALNENLVTNTYTFGTSGGFVTLTVASAGGVASYWNTDANGNWSTGPWTTPAPNSPGAFAGFGGGGTTITAPRTITVDGSFTTGTLAFNNPSFGYSLVDGGGASLTLDNNGTGAFITDSAGSHSVNVPITMTSLGTTVTVNGSGTLTLGGVISGSGAAITKVGTGTLALTGNNTFDGGVTLNAGVTQVNSDTSLGATSAATTFNGGSLQALASHTSTRNFALSNAGDASFDTNGNSLTLSGSITPNGGATGGLVKNGAGTLTLGGTNTYAGSTTVNAGTLSFSNSLNLGASGAGIIAANGATLASTGTTTLNRTLTVNVGGATIDVAPATALTITGVVSGAGNVTVTDTGNLILTNSGNTNNILVTGGATLTAASGSNNNGGLGSGTITVQQNSTVTSNMPALTWQFSNLINVPAGQTANWGTSATTRFLNAATVTGGAGSVLNLTANSSGATELRNSWASFGSAGNAATLNLRGTGTVNFYINGGAFNGPANATLDVGDSVMVISQTNSGGNTINIGALSGSSATAVLGHGTAGGPTYSAGALNTSTTYAGTFEGNANLAKVGTGTLTLTGDSSAWAGTTTVSNGTLLLANATGSATGTGAVNVNSPGVLGGNANSASAVTVNSGGHVAPGDPSITSGVGTLAVAGLTLSAGSGLTFEFVGVGNNDMINTSGLTINGGSLTLYQPGTTNPFASSGTYDLIGYTGSISGTGIASLGIANPQPNTSYLFGDSGTFVTLTIVANPPNYWNVNANGSWGTAGNWSLNSVPNAIDAVANFGVTPGGPVITAPRTVTLDGNRTVGTMNFDGANGFTISQGSSGTLTLQPGSGSANVNVANGNHTISAPVALAVPNTNLNAATGSSLTVSGAVSGTGNGVTVSGAGKVILAGNNSFNGATAVNAGTLQLGHANALQNSALTIGASGTLAFSSGVGTFNIPQFVGSVVLDDVSALPVTVAVGADNSNMTYAGTLSGDGSLIKNGTGTLAFTTANSFSGGIVVNGGIIQVNNNTASFGSGPLTLGNGTTMRMAATGSSVFVGNAINIPAGATANISSALISNGYAGMVTFGDPTSVLQIAASTSSPASTQVSLSSAASQFGTSDGKVLIPSGASIRFSSSNVAFINGGTNTVFEVDAGGGLVTRNGGTVILGALTGDGNVTAGGTGGNVTWQIGGRNGNATFAGVIGDSGGGPKSIVTKLGTGTQSFTGVNTYTGNTTVSAGTLRLATTDTIAQSALVNVTGGTLSIGASQNLVNLTIGAGGTFSADNALLTSGPGLVNATSLTFGGTLTLDAAPTTAGTYDIFDWTNAPTGTFATYALPTAPSGLQWHDFGGGALFDYTTGSVQLEAFTGTPGLWKGANGATWGPGTNWDDGNIPTASTALTFGTAGAGGVVNLNAARNLSANMSIANGTGGAYNLSAGTGGSLNLTGSVTATVTGTQTISAPITGSGPLAKAGAGTLVVTANNTYSGATNVNVGTLAYGASQSNAAGGINVASGATAGIVARGASGVIDAQPALVNGGGDPSGYVPGDKYVIANNVTVAAGGKFDVNDGILVINNGTFSAVNAAVHAGRIFSSTVQYDSNNLLGLTGLGMGDNFDLSYAGIGANNQLTITGSLIPAASDFGQQFIFKYTYIGDANLDGKVTTSDYDFVFGNLGSTTNGVTGNPVIWGDGDFNGNGVVDTTDLDNLFANLGFGTTGNVQPPLLPGTSVPEPSSVALLLLGLAGSAAVIRRKK